MAQFNIHTPKTQSDAGSIRKASRLSKKQLPAGLIAEGRNFNYGYGGEYYYVSEGVVGFLVTKVHLSFDEAKSLFSALEFIGSSEPSPAMVSSVVKESRRARVCGDRLLWFFVDRLESVGGSYDN